MQILNIFHVLLAIGMIILILVQRGAGATAGAAFGSGASGTVFGARGAGNFLTRMTGTFAFLFFGISLTMAVVASNLVTADADAQDSVISDTTEVPAAVAPQATFDIPEAVQAEESDLPVPTATGKEQEPAEEPADNN